MDDEEEFQREIKLMERKINSIKSNIEYMKESNQRKRKQRQVIKHNHHHHQQFKQQHHQHLQPLQLRNDTNLFNKQYTTYQTTPNPITSSSMHHKHNEYQSLLTEDDNIFKQDKPLSLKRTINNDHGCVYGNNNTNNNNSSSNNNHKETTSLRKRFLSKERFKSFDNTTHRNYTKHSDLANYIPSSLSNRSIRKDKHHHHYYNTNNNNNNNINNTSSSYSITDYSLDKRCNTTSNIIYSRNAKRNYNIYTSTQGSITPRNEVNHSEYHSRKRSYCSYEGDNCNNYYDSEDNKDEERIIIEFERVIKDNKNKSDLINKAIALYQASTGNELNNSMDIQSVLFEWIKKLTEVNKKKGNDEDNSKYKLYCESIMQKHKLSNFDELKGMVNNALRRANKKSNFMEGIKKLLLLENTYNTKVQVKNKY